MIVASGALEHLPFAALPFPQVSAAGAKAGEDYRPLIAEHEIVNWPSASALSLIRSESIQREFEGRRPEPWRFWPILFSMRAILEL